MSTHKNALHEQFTAVQKKTFTKYAANLLAGNGYGPIEDIVEDLSDGIKLIELMNCLTKKKKGPKKAVASAPMDILEKHPRNVFQCYANINAALNRITGDGVFLVNIDAEAINAKNEKLILGLIWTLICAYAVESSNKSIDVAMLDYINKILDLHKGTFNLDPISSLLDDAIKDGRVFKVMNYHYLKDDERKHLSPYESGPSDKVKHFDDSMNDANKQLNIPIFLEGRDMDSADQKSVVTQLLMYKEKEASMSQDDILKDKLKSKITAAQQAREKAKTFDSLANDLIKWITDREQELLKNPDDMTPEDITDRMNFASKHFKTDKPLKSDEFNKLLGDVSKFKLECENNDIVAPPVRTAAMVGAWHEMCKAEKIMLDHLSKLKAIYKKLFAMLREFNRKCNAYRQNTDDVKANTSVTQDVFKTSNISNLTDCEIANEVLKSDIANLNEALNEIQEYVDKSVKPLCPSPKFEKERFTSPIDEMRELTRECEKGSDNCDKLLAEATDRCNKSREILKDAAKKLNRAADNVTNFSAYCKQHEPFDSLEEFEASTTSMSPEKYQKIGKDLEEAADLYKKNAQVLNLPYDEATIVNPYTNIRLPDIREKAAALDSEYQSKREFDNKELERLKAKADTVSKIIEAIDALNNDIDKINLHVDGFNTGAGADVTNIDKSIEELMKCQKDLNELKPAMDRVAKTADNIPDLETDLNLLRSNHGSALESVSNGIESLNQAKNSAKVGEDVSLTDKEIQSIEKTFKNCDSDRNGQLSFDDYFTCLVSVPLVGVNKISKNSPEIVAFFKQYSPNGNTIDLQSLKNLYADCKKNFIVNSKDAVKKMLTSRADEENMIAEDQLIALLGNDYFAKLKPSLTATQKNGKTVYPLNEIL